MGDLTNTLPQPYDTSPYRIRTGRPAQYSQEIADDICNRIAEGISLKAAANANGISYETLRTWAHEREDFSVAVARARAQAEILLTRVMVDTATGKQTGGDWRPADQVLKQQFASSGWGEKIQLKGVADEAILAMWRQQQQANAITEDGDTAYLPGDDLL